MAIISEENGGSPTKLEETELYSDENVSTGGSINQKDTRKSLERRFEDVKNKKGALEAQRYIDRNKIRQAKAGILSQVFSALRAFGVDLNNPESIRSFFQTLEGQDPELVELFDLAISSLLPENLGGGELTGEQGKEEGENSLMNRYTDLQSRVSRS